jgi:hypothetical protein
VGAALTKPGRVSTARWCGSGERDGEEYGQEPVSTSLKGLPAQIWRIWAGCGAYLLVRPMVWAVGNSWVVLWMATGRSR